MNELIAICYPNETRASEVLIELRKLQAQLLVNLDDVVIVTRDNKGKLKLNQTVNLTKEGAANGAFWGFLIGLVFSLPFPFLAPVMGLGWAAASAGAGALAGAVGGHFSDYGINDAFIKEISSSLINHTSALFVLAHDMKADRVLPELSKYGGTVLRTSLTAEAEGKLRAALGPASSDATLVAAVA